MRSLTCPPLGNKFAGTSGDRVHHVNAQIFWKDSYESPGERIDPLQAPPPTRVKKEKFAAWFLFFFWCFSFLFSPGQRLRLQQTRSDVSPAVEYRFRCTSEPAGVKSSTGPAYAAAATTRGGVEVTQGERGSTRPGSISQAVGVTLWLLTRARTDTPRGTQGSGPTATPPTGTQGQRTLLGYSHQDVKASTLGRRQAVKNEERDFRAGVFKIKYQIVCDLRCQFDERCLVTYAASDHQTPFKNTNS